MLVTALAAGAVGWWWSMRALPHLQTVQIQGTSAQLLSQGEARQRVLLLAPADQALDETTLRRFAEGGDLRLLQLPFVAGDCKAQQQLISQASEELGGAPTLVAGIGPAAASAWRWLATGSIKPCSKPRLINPPHRSPQSERQTHRFAAAVHPLHHRRRRILPRQGECNDALRAAKKPTYRGC